MRHGLLFAAVFVSGLLAQSDLAELRLTVKDAAGDSVPAAVELVNQATQTRQNVKLPADGRYAFKNLPFGLYRLLITQPGFATSSELIELRSAVPQSRDVTLGVQPLQTTVEVADAATLLDLNQTANAHYIGSEQVKERGLPVEGADELPDVSFLITQYGEKIVSRVNFGRGRVAPSFSLDGSVGADLWRHEKRSVTVQADIMNVTNRLNLINFAGLLSGTALAPPRSVGIRLRTEF